MNLETSRLKLRWFVSGDEDLLLAIWNDPAFIQYVGDRGIRTLEEAGEAMASGPLKLYEDHGYGPFRISLPDADQAIGLCGVFRRDNLDHPDIGFALLPEYCGKGYAYEAAAAVTAYARDDLRLPCITAIVSPDNSASIALIRKLGLNFERMIKMPNDDKEICLYAIYWGEGS